MAADINDLLGRPSNPSNYAIATTVKTNRSIGVTSLEAYDLSKWATDTPVYFITYKKTVDPATDKVTITNKTGWKALVNADTNTLTNLTLAPGYTDIGNAEGDFIECIPTALWGNDLIDWGLAHANPDGTLKDGIVTEGKYADDSIPTAAYKDGSVTASKLATGAITLGYAERTTDGTTTATSIVQFSDLSASVTIPGGGRRVKITVYLPQVRATGATNIYVELWDGVVGSGTRLQRCVNKLQDSGDSKSILLVATTTPSAGAKTYNVGWRRDANATITAYLNNTSPAFILVEAI